MALVQSKSNFSSLATVAATWDTPATAGNLLLITMAGDDYAASPPTGFTQSTGCNQIGFMGHYVWWKVAAGGETTVNYVIGSATASAWASAEISGLTATPYDISNGNFTNTGGATYTTPAVQPTAGDRYVVTSMGSTDDAGAVTSNFSSWINGFTERQDTGQTSGTLRLGVAFADLAATYNGSSTIQGGATYADAAPNARSAIIIAFKVATGGGVTARSVQKNQAVNRAGTY